MADLTSPRPDADAHHHGTSLAACTRSPRLKAKTRPTLLAVARRRGANRSWTSRLSATARTRRSARSARSALHSWAWGMASWRSCASTKPGSVFGQCRTPNVSSESYTVPVMLTGRKCPLPQHSRGLPLRPSMSAPAGATDVQHHRRPCLDGVGLQNYRSAVGAAGVGRHHQAVAPRHALGLVLHVCCTRRRRGRGPIRQEGATEHRTTRIRWAVAFWCHQDDR